VSEGKKKEGRCKGLTQWMAGQPPIGSGLKSKPREQEQDDLVG
jgi:hypothetical protein